MKIWMRIAAGFTMLLVFRAVARGEATVRFDLTLESRELPGMDSSPTIDGPPGTEHLFTGNLVISSIRGSVGAAVACEHPGNLPVQVPQVAEKIDRIEKQAQYL